MPKKPVRARADAPPSLLNRDHLERANFALQASVYLQQLGAGASASASSSAATAPAAASSSTAPGTCVDAFAAPQVHVDRKGKRRASEAAPLPGGAAAGGAAADFARLGREEMRAFRRWTVHSLVKMDPGVKRSVCVCNTVLVPGLTARVRVRPSKTHFHVAHTTCTTCGTGRSVPVPPSAASVLDGPVRARRRARTTKPTPFHLRERPYDPSTLATDPEPTTKGKAKGKKGVPPPDDAQAGPLGHVLWRGAERVGGWGVMQESPNTLAPPPRDDPERAHAGSAKLTPDDAEELATNA